MKHTKTPWRVHNNIGRKGETGITADEAPCIIAVMGNAEAWPVEAQANAAFIVKACNSHDELRQNLEALLFDFVGMEHHRDAARALLARLEEKQ